MKMCIKNMACNRYSSAHEYKHSCSIYQCKPAESKIISIIQYWCSEYYWDYIKAVRI